MDVSPSKPSLDHPVAIARGHGRGRRPSSVALFGRSFALGDRSAPSLVSPEKLSSGDHHVHREDNGMPTGTIARLLIDKGFGFIRDDSGVEHFFHRSSVRGAVFELLREGQHVEFTPEDSGKGPRAGDIRLLEG